jgi:hypothetical protein
MIRQITGVELLVGASAVTYHPHLLPVTLPGPLGFPAPGDSDSEVCLKVGATSIQVITIMTATPL